MKYAAVFAAGVAVGANWPRIKKSAAPLLEMLKAQYGDSFADLVRSMAEDAQGYDEPMAEAKTSRRTRRKPAADLAEAFAAAAQAGAAAAARDAAATAQPRTRRKPAAKRTTKQKASPTRRRTPAAQHRPKKV